MRAKHQLRDLRIGAVREGRRRFAAVFEFSDPSADVTVAVDVRGHLTREHLPSEAYDHTAADRRWVVSRLELTTEHGTPLGSKIKQYVPLSLVEEIAGIMDLRRIDVAAHHPVGLPEGTRHRVRLTDEFLISVADSWIWHRLQGRKDPAVAIAEEAGLYDLKGRPAPGERDDAARTVGGWVDAARRAGHLGPTARRRLRVGRSARRS